MDRPDANLAEGSALSSDLVALVASGPVFYIVTPPREEPEAQVHLIVRFYVRHSIPVRL